RIRNYQPGDKPAMYYICMKTGDRGGDGEPFYEQDPDALGRIYVGPYAAFEPDSAFILEDEEGVSGYIVGALVSRKFYDRYEREWRPGLCEEFASPSGDPKSWSSVERIYHLYHHPGCTSPENFDDYPSHLHINLLARAQGQGHGWRLTQQLLQQLRSQGSTGIHLNLSVLNKRAYGFYKAAGFQELSRQANGEGGSICMGLRLAEVIKGTHIKIDAPGLHKPPKPKTASGLIGSKNLKIIDNLVDKAPDVVDNNY
ncbi:MAG: GNAT family N-acetyltransferase, partial [Pirellulales bacterium]